MFTSITATLSEIAGDFIINLTTTVDRSWVMMMARTRREDVAPTNTESVILLGHGFFNRRRER